MGDSSEDDCCDRGSQHAEDISRNIDISGLYSESLPVASRPWLSIPESFLKPMKMCAVNQFVHIVPELNESYMTHTCELVLFGTGSSIPEHFRHMVYCMEMVRKFT